MLQEQDRTVVSGQIATLDQSLSQLEAVESRLVGELDVIRAKIESIRNQRAALESRIAAVWSLPNELLSYIFELGVLEEKAEAEVDDQDDDNDEGSTVKIGFQVQVSQVCRMFRKIAIRTPSLWTQISIFDLAPARIDYVRTCVERSVCSKLDFAVDCEDPHLGDNTEPIRSLMAILVPHIPRWKRFTARLWGFHALYRIMEVLDWPAPHLETLDLSDVDYEKGFDPDDPFEPPALREPLILFCGVTPKLESVALDGVHIAWSRSNLSKLVDLRMGYHSQDVRPTYDEFKAIIDASPDLRCLDLRGSAPLLSEDPTDADLYAPLRMDRLEEMTISDIRSDCATTLIPLLHAPNLKSLSLTDLDTNDYSVFLCRIVGPPALFPALTTLKLAAIEVRDEVIEDLLRGFPKVTNLALYFNEMPLHWLSFLEPRDPEGEVLCPKIESLRCVAAPTEDIRRVLEKRREAGYPIARLEIDKDAASWASKGCMKWLRENVTLEIVDPSDHGSDDEIDTASDWETDEDVGLGLPYFSMAGLSDEDDEDEDFEDSDEELEVDGSESDEEE